MRQCLIAILKFVLGQIAGFDAVSDYFKDFLQNMWTQFFQNNEIESTSKCCQVAIGKEAKFK